MHSCYLHSYFFLLLLPLTTLRVCSHKMRIINSLGKVLMQLEGEWFMKLPPIVPLPMRSISWESSSADREPVRHVSTALLLHNRWLWSDTNSFHCCYCCHLWLLLRPHQSITLQLSRGMLSDPLHPISNAARLLSTPVTLVTITPLFHHPTRQMWTHNRYCLCHYQRHSIFVVQLQSPKPYYRKPVDNFVVFVLRPVLAAEACTTIRKRKHYNKNEHNNLITVKWQNPIMQNEKQEWVFIQLACCLSEDSYCLTKDALDSSGKLSQFV